MTTNEMLVSVLSQFPGATMVRRSKQNFIAVPLGENDEGKMEYAKVAVSALLSKDTKTNTAFDFDAAVAEYAEWQSSQTAKASKPKASKGPDPAKQAEKQKRKTALAAWFAENPGEHTCSDVLAALPEVYEGKSVMTVGSDAKELMEEGVLVKRSEKGKNFYALA